MNYSNTTKLAVLSAITVALFSFSTPSYAKGTTINAGAVAGIKEALANRATSSFSIDGNSDPLIVDCTYTLDPDRLNMDATYLDFTFMEGQDDIYGAYGKCMNFAQSACQFLIGTIGVPEPLKVHFTGNVSNEVKTCGSF